tara:strand:- start:111 stop:1829 length:1719 start_codon:yes stop_codon:yes gene_type:complete
MKSKILSLFLLTAILSIAMVSATVVDDITLSLSNDLTKSVDETTLTITNANTSDIDVDIPSITAISDGDGHTIAITVNETNPITIPGSGSKQVIISHTLIPSEKEELATGDFSTTIEVEESSTPADKVSINLNFVADFCEIGEQGEQGDEDEDVGLLEIVDVKIDNDDGDDLDWIPLDSITIEVEVENIGDDKVRDIIVEIGLFDANGKNIIDDMKNLDKEEVELGSINEDDEDTAVFEFQVPADFEDDTYSLVVKAYSDDMDEDTVCTSKATDFDENDYYEKINGERETDEEKHIVIDNIRISPTEPQCGEIVQVSAEVFNIGDEDYEDQIRVTFKNEALGIDKELIIREDFDQGDSEIIDFEFEIPQDAELSAYTLEFRTFYDYDDKDEFYDLVSENKFFKSFAVDGNCILIPESSVKITANLDDSTPEANAGEQVIIKATLENTGEDTTLYTISVYGNSAWSSLENIDPSSIIIPAGESKDVEIILNIDEGIEGNKELTIKAEYSGETTEQKVQLSVSAGATSGITGAAISEHLKTNGFIYAIVLINLILIIAIILVIRRMVETKVPAL